MDPNAGTTQRIRNGRQVFVGDEVDRELLGKPKGNVSEIKQNTIFLQPITGPQSSDNVNPTLKEPDLEPVLTETPALKDPPPTTRGGAPPENPISQGILNLLFICFLYWVSTKILVFYGISNDIYLVYFMFYVFLYVTTLLIPTTYERFD